MPDDLSFLIKEINKDLKGAAKVSNLCDVATPYGTRLSTGILSLDLKLKGGFPAGTMVQLFGPEGSGKDYLSNLTMAQVQKKHGDKANLFWLSFGYKPDKDFMRMAGVQIPYTDEELAEKGYDPKKVTDAELADIGGLRVGNILYLDADFAAASEHPAETLLSAAIRCVKSNKFQLGVINELGSGETRDNVVKELHEEAKIATWASLMSDFCRKYYTALRQPDENGSPNQTCIMMINPVRANMDARSARFNKFTQGGGYALKHAKVIDIHIRSGASLKQSGKLVGKEIKWKVSKGKHGISEGAEGEYQFYFGQGVDLVRDLAYTAKLVGVVKNSGPVYYILDYEDKIKGGLDGVISLLRDEDTIRNEVRDAVLRESSIG